MLKHRGDTKLQVVHSTIGKQKYVHKIGKRGKGIKLYIADEYYQFA